LPSLLELRHISKAYPGVQALDDVSFAVTRGEVHALLGANGAGKSTLIKILAGAVQRDAGEIEFDGVRVGDTDPHDAAVRGIAVLYQEPALVPHLSVEQNMFLGQEQTGRFGLVRRDQQRRQASAILAEVADWIDPADSVAALRASERQLVALAKSLLRTPKLLILDEPTASMTEREIGGLFTIIDRTRRNGTAILYISHRLEEVYTIADRMTVLRDGRHVATAKPEDLPRPELVAMIAGREMRAAAGRETTTPGEPLLEAQGLARDGVFRDISFKVHAGEIVALAGLVGAGRTEIARAVLGADPLDAGTIRFPGGDLQVRDPAQGLKAGVAMVPEDRKRTGIVPQMSVADNLLMSSIARYANPAGLIDRPRARAAIAAAVEGLDIRPRGSESRPVETLSGGNQQKVVLGRAVASGAKVLILDEPTAGVDVGAKAEIHRLVTELAAGGHGILLISSEMEEVLNLADRILVIREGRLVRELEGHGASSLDVIRSALGEHQMEPVNVE
jgi:ABC-type sugar transport system ATPase subunit